ncbi:MAG: hypothetical protein AAB510_02090 [Patescibacteria group bacterium]
MLPEEKKLLEDTLELSKENNEMLHAMRRSQRFSQIMTVVYWVFILGVGASAYYFIQPYFESLFSVYGGSDINSVFNQLNK